MAGWGLWNNDIEFISSQHAPALSYIYQPRPTAGLRVEENKTIGEAWWKAAIRHLLYISPTLFYVPLPALGPSFSYFISCSPFSAMVRFNTSILFSSIFLTHPPSLPQNLFLPPCLSFSREGSTISLATAGWGVLSSQVQGDGRLGRLASAHSVFTLRYLLPMNTKLHWTWGV